MARSSKVLCVVALIFLISCTEAQSIPPELLGTWQSDEELTLESVRKSDSVPRSDLAIFEDDFFGDRVIIFREIEIGAYFENSADEPVFGPYDIVDSGDEFVVLRIPPTEYEGETEQAWYVEGDLIYAYIEKWKFRETTHKTFETPVLFYAIILVAFVTGQTGTLLLGLAWTFVALRFIHSYVHLTSNVVIVRFRVFGASMLVLSALWVMVLTNIMRQ